MSSSDNTHRILVVDDNATIHETFRGIFPGPRSDSTAQEQTAVAQTFAVDSALQGQEALEMVRKAAAQGRPYLTVFADIRMPPGWDGVETAVRIWEEFPNQQIILCTDLSDDTWEEIVDHLGRNDRLLILRKPFDAAEVRQLVTATITRNLAERQKQESQTLADRVGKDYAKALADSRRMMDALRESEATIRAIVDTAAEGVILTDEQGIVETFNAAAQEIFGYRAEEVCDGHIKELLVPETYRVLGRFINNRTDDGQAPVLHADGLAERKDGTQFPVLVAGSQVRLGDRWLFTWLVRDISDSKRAEEQLAVFRRFVDASGQGFGMSDLEGNITYANPTLRRLVGEENPESTSLDKSAMFRRNFTAHYPQQLQEKIWNDVIPTVMQRGQWEGKLATRTNTGTVTPTLENYFLIRDDDGYPICLAFVVTDMTRHEQAQQELKEYADALEAANRALKESCAVAEAANRSKTEFLANMSHELRTPLHGILSFAAFGLQKAATADRESLLRYFQRVDQSGRVLLKLVNDLLDLSKLESGRMSFAMSRMDIPTLLRSAVDEFASTAAQRHISIECRRPDFDASVVADPDKIAQVVRNLLGNAVKFSPDHSTINIDLRRNGSLLRVSVSDRGVGIPETELEFIFDRFIQSSKTRTGAGGTGLGLAISREIISAHKGRIWAGNRPEGGAVLSFELPFDLSKEPNEEQNEEPDEKPSPTDRKDVGLVACDQQIDESVIAHTPTCS